MNTAFLLLLVFPFFLCGASLYNICTSPQYCRLHPIKYPFGLSDQGCGHPHFQIECLENHALITINKQNYRILNASYERRSIKVVSEAVLQSPCGLPASTVNLSATPFHMVAGRYSNLTLLINCVGSVPNFSRINCSANSYLGFTDPKLADWPGRCELSVQIPVPSAPAPDRNVAGGRSSTISHSMLQQGFELFWDHDANIHENCSSCNLTRGICGYNASDSKTPFLCYCPDGPHSRNCSDGVGGGRAEGKSYMSSVIGGIIGCNILVAAAALFAVARWKRRNRASDLIPHPDDFSFNHVEGVADDLISNKMYSSPIKFSYEELEESTNYFDEKKELGYGGFGTVYLGKLRDGNTVAVKKLHRNNSARVEQFANEVRILSLVRHSNLVRLFGYCPDRRNLLLVYEYVPNGTLAAHLHGEQKGKGLLWETRLNIALETAEALAFLHFCIEPPILHRDIKSTNILLDETFTVKVADFGLSRLLSSETTHVDTVPQGTPGYLDPNDQHCYQLTDKGDVYSFGVVLVEIISAKNAGDITRDGKEISLAHLATSKIQSGALHELVDPHLDFDSNLSVRAMVTRVAELAFLCLGLEKDDRPSMTEIVSQLRQIKQSGYGYPEDRQNCGSLFKECKLATDLMPFSPTSVQANWSSSHTSPENSS